MFNHPARACLAICLALLAIGSRSGQARARAADESVVAFVGVNVLPMDREYVLRNRTVLVRGDRIETIGRAGRVPVPEGAAVVKGKGRYLMPGLADMHVHTWYREEHIFYIANGVTTIRDMWGSEGHVRFRDEILRGESFGATMSVATPSFVGPGAVIDRAQEVTRAGETKRALRKAAAMGYDYVKVHERLGSVPYRAAVKAARKAGIPIVGHVPAPVGVNAVFAAGVQRSISHFRMFPSRLGATNWLSPLTEAPMRSLARELRDLDIYNDPTLVTLRYVFTPAEAEAFRNHPDLKYTQPWELERWYYWFDTYGPWTPPASRDVHLENKLKMLRALFDARAPILLGTDGGYPFIIQGYAMHEELELYVQAGLRPFDALHIATVGAAEFLGVSDEVGKVQEGLRADLVLLEANPFQRIHNTRKIAGVVVRGQWLDAAELKRRLEEVAAIERVGDHARLRPSPPPSAGNLHAAENPHW
ncbi:MAG: amidohydrolase family protein [Acidobacteria bacterium]|nr:amidohydrolase family protein [Acidobacteriota bacterium]